MTYHLIKATCPKLDKIMEDFVTSVINRLEDDGVDPAVISQISGVMERYSVYCAGTIKSEITIPFRVELKTIHERLLIAENELRELREGLDEPAHKIG